jgi:hypothetical protein
MSLPIPTIGDWFQAPDGELFEVVAVDDDDGTIEIQYFDGTVEEIDYDAWEESQYFAAEPPEDYSGPLDMEREDYGMDLERAGSSEWGDPLDYIDQAE